MTDKEPESGFYYKWVTPEMYSEGYYEMRNGIVYHCDFRGKVVRRDQYGNYLVRIPKVKRDADGS